MGEATFVQVRTEMDARTERGDFRQVAGEKYDSGPKFTTPETIAIERSNVATMLRGQGTAEPMMAREEATAQAETRKFLNSSQKQVIEEVLTSPDRVHGLQGLAGTGKTTTLEAIREGAEKSGYAVEGFAPTSRALAQLRDAGISATTLQSFIARGGQDKPQGPSERHLYMLDESSLASARQMRDFLKKVGPEDRILVIGDTRQHQGVDAGRPFEQMQDAGMRTSQLNKIMRQKDPELLKAVEHLARQETVIGVAMLSAQGRVTEIASSKERIAAIAKDYAAQPENTIIVSPDNRSRQKLNQAVRTELMERGLVANDAQKLQTLTHRSDITGADRGWAARYDKNDVLQYTTGSKAEGVARGSFATVTAIDAKNNTITVQRENGKNVTYDPKRLKGVNAFKETTREFSTGDRIQFTAPDKRLAVANRDLATITSLSPTQITAKMDGKANREITFDPREMRQFDHGYALTSHSSQGLTTGRVLANIDTDSSRQLINSRLAYVAISRASQDARIYTNNAKTLGQRLDTDVTETAAVDFRRHDREVPNAAYNATEQRRRAAINAALTLQEARQFQWKAETGSIQTYQHTQTHRNIHIDGNTGQFYSQDRTTITKDAALKHTLTSIASHSRENAPMLEHSPVRPASPQSYDYDQGIGR